ncbi:MAG: hypothetical protein ACTSPI_00905 [Candidatus Heimdallarchaeaceae archaeon]
MPGNIIKINNFDNLEWYVGDSKMEYLIKILNEIGFKRDKNLESRKKSKLEKKDRGIKTGKKPERNQNEDPGEYYSSEAEAEEKAKYEAEMQAQEEAYKQAEWEARQGYEEY